MDSSGPFSRCDRAYVHIYHCLGYSLITSLTVPPPFMTLNNIQKVGEGTLTIKQAAKEAYSTELRPYHSKLVRAAFSSVLPTLSSTRRQLHCELIKEKVTPCASGSCNIVSSSSRMSLKADDEESFHQQMYWLGTLVLKSRDSITGALQSKGISTDW